MNSSPAHAAPAAAFESERLPGHVERARWIAAIEERWNHALNRARVEPRCGSEVFSEIVHAYSEVWRRYHTLEHLHRLLGCLRQECPAAHDEPAVLFAALFHDYVYRPKAPDNEERSAVACREALSSLGVPEPTIAEAERLILLTKKHLSADGGDLERAFIDADLAILAAPWDDYLVYARRIRQEYAAVPADAYVAGRSAFVKSMSAAPCIFRGELRSPRWDERARENLRREGELLAARPETLLGSPAERLHWEWPGHVVALTGTIGSGKSAALRCFAEKGAVVLSADAVVDALYAPGGALVEPLRALLGEAAVGADGAVDRRTLAAAVFSDSEKKLLVEALVHPAVHEAAGRFFAAALQRGAGALVYEAPVLFESGLETVGFRRIILVTADEERCVERIIARSNCRLSSADAHRRIAAQMPVAEKEGRADLVIRNNGALSDLACACEAAWKSCGLGGVGGRDRRR